MSSLLSTVQSLPDDERAALERALIPLARQGAIGALAGDLTHDAGNALFGLIGLLGLVDADAPLHGERLELLRASASELDGIARPMLAFVRGDVPGPGDLVAATRVALELYRHGVRRELPVAAAYSEGTEPVVLDQATTLQAVVHVLLAADPRAGLSVAVSAGELRVSPLGADSLDRLIAARIAADAGGSLETDGDALVLRIPTAIP